MSNETSDNARWERETLQQIVKEHLQEKKRARRWNLFFRLLILGYIGVALLSFVDWSSFKEAPAKAHTAVVRLKGLIADGQPASAATINKLLRKAFDDKNTRGVVLEVNSPGGTPVQAALIYAEIKRLRAQHPDKKLYAVVADLCASGGYYVASAADEIYASPSSMVGSIGVRLDAFGVVDLMHKLGIERRTLVAGKNKALLDPSAPRNEAQTTHLQHMLDEVHQQFIDAVKKGRGSRLIIDDDIFSGLVWSGESAKRRGLIDGFGDTRYVAEEKIGVKHTVVYEREKTLLEELTRGVGVSLGMVLSERLVEGVANQAAWRAQ